MVEEQKPKTISPPEITNSNLKTQKIRGRLRFTGKDFELGIALATFTVIEYLAYSSYFLGAIDCLHGNFRVGLTRVGFGFFSNAVGAIPLLISDKTFHRKMIIGD